MKYRLHTSKSNKMVGGVCAGLAESLDADVTLIRILVFLACVIQSFFIVVYFVLSVALPTDKGEALPGKNTGSKHAPSNSGTEKTYSAQGGTSSAHYSESSAANSRTFTERRTADGSYTGDFEAEKNKGGLNTVIAVVLICMGICLILAKYVFSIDLSASEIFGFAMIAGGLFLLIGGITEPRGDGSTKAVKCVIGGILLYSGIARVLEFFGLTGRSGLASSYIYSAAGAMWPLFAAAVGLTLLIPHKKTVAVVWSLFVFALIAGTVILFLFGSFAAFVSYFGF